MKLIRLRNLAWSLLAASFASHGFAQAVPPSADPAQKPPSAVTSKTPADASNTPAPEAPVAAPSASTEEEDLVELSIFVVSTEQDTGYQAQSTLAGSRLATPLEDLGAAISVYTKDFMTDIGATNAGDLLPYATGMEASGSQGNFSGTNSSIGETQVVGDGPRTDPQSGSRSRGLNAPSYTRNYFLTNISLDGYNTTSVTVNRGPNAILFGVASPSGVVDNSLMLSNLNRNRAKVEFRIGDNGSARGVLDINQVVIPKKLAVRFAALDDREQYDQEPAYEDKSRLFGTATFKPSSSTILTANFETGKTRANRPITVLPFNSINEYWLAAGRRTFDWTFYDDPVRNPLAASQNASNDLFKPPGVGRAQVFGAIAIPYDNLTPNGGPGPSFRTSFNGTNSTTNPPANTIRQQILHPILNRDLGNDTFQFYETGNIAESIVGAALFPGGVKPAGLKMQGFTNYDAFPFNKQMIDETSRQSDDFHTYNISLSQTGWKDDRGADRLGVELVYNSEYFERYANNASFSQGNGNHIRIDVNVTLPDGRPNPNVGRPYVYGASAAQLNFFESEKENIRATAFIRHNFSDTFSDGLGGWLGHHTLTGLYEEYSTHDLTSSTRLRMFGAAADSISSNISNFNRLPNAFIYLGDSILDGRDLKLAPIRIRPLEDGQTTDTSYFSAPAGLVNGVLTQGQLLTSQSTVVEGINQARARGEKIKSGAFVLHSYWAMDHLITTVGWRKDKDYLKVFPDKNLTTDPLAKRIYLSDYDFPSTPEFNMSGDTMSYGAVLRWPQKLVRLPRGMDVSVFFNKSENFTPDGGRINVQGLALAPPSGETEEIGFSVSLFEDKLNLRFNHFETSQINATINPSNPGSAYGSTVNNYSRQLATFWNTQVNATPQFDRINDVNELLDTLPGVKALLNWQRVGTPPEVVSDSQTPLPTFYDTQDFVSTGTEVEVIYNPTRQWRIAVNFAEQETVLSNLSPGLKWVVEKLSPVWEKYKDTPRAATDTWGGPGVPLPSSNPEHLGTLIQRDVMVPYATAIAQEGVVSAEQRKYRANLVTNYQFGKDTVLKGFGIGTGVRWQSKYAMGYPTSFQPDGSVFVDIDNPYWSDDDLNVDAWVSYARKINDKIDWRVQLNVRNLIGSTDPVVVTVQPDGSPAVTRLPPEQRIYLTNTFEF
jgi:hypothetical protein